MFENILVVCVGNICRSPLGEALLSIHFPEKAIHSAGISAERSRLVGKQADNTMLDVARKHNIDLSSHQAQQLTHDLCRQADLILVMEKGHIEKVREISPESTGKVMLFGRWLEGNQEIADPYRQSREMFEAVYKQIETAALAWQKKLSR